MVEIWRDIPEYEGLYQVSNLGRVKNIKTGRYLEGYIRTQRNGKKYDKRRSLQLTIGKYTSKHEYMYRLVAAAFPEICGEYFEGAEVDHIDGDSLNDVATNLRWVTHKENMNNPVSVERFQDNYEGWERRPVIQYDLDGNFIKEWESINDCKKAGFNNVWHCIHGLLKQNKGYKWAYKEKGNAEALPLT